MDLYASKGPALPQKLAITAIEVGLVALSAWLMFGGGEAAVAAAFGFEPAEIAPARRWLILAFNIVILVRMAFMMFVLMRRTMPWEEVATVPLAFALYYVGFAVLVLPSQAPIGPWDWLGVALFVSGCVLNTGGELQRHRFKSDPANAGRLFTGGFFALSMHINFFGDILWVLGYAIVADNPWAFLIPLVTASFFAFYNVPALDRHLAARYGVAFANYRRTTARLVPFVW